jgi:hypothetical protein
LGSEVESVSSLEDESVGLAAVFVVKVVDVCIVDGSVEKLNALDTDTDTDTDTVTVWLLSGLGALTLTY